MDPKVQSLIERPRIKQHTAGWYNARKIRLTASDVPAVLGHNPYCSRREVFLRKTMQKIPPPYSVACNHGLKFEALAAKAYSEITGIQCIDEDLGLIIHKDHDCFGASPDRVVYNSPILVEIKCPFRRKIVPGQIPKHYLDQIEFQMEVCDLDIAHFVEFIPGNLNRRGIVSITEKKRDPKWWLLNRPILDAFWSEVIDYWNKNPYKQAPRKVQLNISTGKLDEIKDDDEIKNDDFDFNTNLTFDRDSYDIFIQEALHMTDLV